LLNEDGKKLSKRHGDLSVGAFRKQHTLPKALTNLLVLCGGGFLSKENPDVTKELKNIEDLCTKVRNYESNALTELIRQL
jgi:glutamyl/glutaminyl-tRNA synthetase